MQSVSKFPERLYQDMLKRANKNEDINWQQVTICEALRMTQNYSVCQVFNENQEAMLADYYLHHGLPPLFAKEMAYVRATANDVNVANSCNANKWPRVYFFLEEEQGTVLENSRGDFFGYGYGLQPVCRSTASVQLGKKVEHVPLDDLKKQVHGTYHALHNEQNKLTLVRWHDNAATMASNISLPDDIEKLEKIALVPQRNIVQLIQIRPKKWYWAILRSCLNGAMVNTCLLYHNLETISFLESYRRIVETLLAATDTSTPSGILSKSSSHVADEIHLDNEGHLNNKTYSATMVDILKVAL
ncbi:hypothetical protein ILUMI_02644 [Ignelater luminosus]|uniref:Uncharacterized protein n=1 Tax=Ignelater luminosus TaxID=2038154 RepID=A0A8K0DHW1_IGNLU|nr:hypothetical protein ILUMI_02644 [Ignelater luminosus]